MKKEVALAIIIGFAIGLVITYGIYTAQKALQSHTVTDSSSKPTTDQTPEQDRTLHIVSPENETVASEKSTTLAGTTSPNSYVVILTTDQEYLTQADENGNFAKEITLEAGANYINVTAIDANLNQVSQTIVITYTTANLDGDQDASTDQQEPTNG